MANLQKVELFSEYVLYTTDDKFYISGSTYKNTPKEALVVDRQSKDVRIEQNVYVPRDGTAKVFYGVLGVLPLIAGSYLIIITKRELMGEIAGHQIFRVASTEVIPYSKSTLHLNKYQIRDNRTYLSMLNLVLAQKSFYYSYTYDVTHTMQRLYFTTPEFQKVPFHKRADQRFVWNKYLLDSFTRKNEFASYCLPVMFGFVSINKVTIADHNFTWTLVSRRSCMRVGVRLFTRGADSMGNVANYVETEQIVEFVKEKCSFVQIRGSIPLYWTQLPNLKYKPPPSLDRNQNQGVPVAKHFDEQVSLYGKVVVINLIDQKGPEQELERRFAAAIQEYNNPYVRYEAFDFHKECRKMRYDKLSILMERLAEDQRNNRYFHVLSDLSVMEHQDGVFRTNCIDCLDRTNVVQSMLAKQTLVLQLQKFFIMGPTQQLEDTEFNKLFQSVWADNADVISTQYSGTGALKTDFTRTGKRTYNGVLNDGMNALMRYYKNNFSDGFRQDSYDLFLGYYKVSENEGADKPGPLRTKQGWRFYLMPYFEFLAIAMAMFTLIIPAEYTLEVMLFFLFWLAMAACTFLLIMSYGPEFVNKPKLKSQ